MPIFNRNPCKGSRRSCFVRKRRFSNQTVNPREKNVTIAKPDHPAIVSPLLECEFVWRLSGMITIKSHSGVTNPEERLRPCKAIDFRMTKIDTRRFSVTTTSKSCDHYQSDADRPFPKDRWAEHLTIARISRHRSSVI